VLTRTVQEAWRNLPEDTIQRAFNRLPVLHQLIVECGGDNMDVEKRKGYHKIAAAPGDSFAPRKNMRDVGNLLVSNQPRHTSQL
jgi:hypothetical protein